MKNYKNNTKYLFKSLKRLFFPRNKRGDKEGEGGGMIELINKKKVYISKQFLVDL